MKKPEILKLIENASASTCEALDKICFELVEKHGYDSKHPIKTKRKMIEDGVGIVFNYAFKEEVIYLWWELWKYENDKPTEKIDETIKIKAITRKI